MGLFTGAWVMCFQAWERLRDSCIASNVYPSVGDNSGKLQSGSPSLAHLPHLYSGIPCSLPCRTITYSWMRVGREWLESQVRVRGGRVTAATVAVVVSKQEICAATLEKCVGSVGNPDLAHSSHKSPSKLRSEPETLAFIVPSQLPHILQILHNFFHHHSL